MCDIRWQNASNILLSKQQQETSINCITYQSINYRLCQFHISWGLLHESSISIQLYSSLFIPTEDKITLTDVVNKQRRVPCATNGVLTTPISKGETHKILKSDSRSVKYLLCQKLKITAMHSLFTGVEWYHQLPIINESINHNQLRLSHKLVEVSYTNHLHPLQY